MSKHFSFKFVFVTENVMRKMLWSSAWRKSQSMYFLSLPLLWTLGLPQDFKNTRLVSNSFIYLMSKAWTFFETNIHIVLFIHSVSNLALFIQHSPPGERCSHRRNSHVAVVLLFPARLGDDSTPCKEINDTNKELSGGSLREII